mgnify:CR=1 FL=1
MPHLVNDVLNEKTYREAVNFSAIMIATRTSDKVLSRRFDDISSSFDIACPICTDYGFWCNEFNLEKKDLERAYNETLSAFARLEPSDEVISKDSEFYPERLKNTEDSPRFLYLRGDKSLLLEPRAVALIGSRNASEEGKYNTARVANMLGKNGYVIVSGLAKGIDASAHIAALENNYKTIAVIGTSIGQYYPKENEEIQKEIERKGLVVSQFSPVLKTERWFFPLRNGVMSGLVMANVVMEAGEKSGSLIQARIAFKQHRLVFIPKKIFDDKSLSWPDKLVKNWAIVVNSPLDILETLRMESVKESSATQKDLFD